MSANANGPNGGRSRRLPALRLDDDGTTNAVSGRVDKTVPLAIYDGSTAQGRTPLTTTEGVAPITPAATSAAQAPLPASSTSTSVAAQEDKTIDELDGPPLTKTPWGLLVAGLVVVVVLGGAVALFLVLGSGEKKAGEPPRPNGSATALPATSATPLP